VNDEILELERRYVDAWVRIDEEMIRELTTDDATWINAAGRLEGLDGSLDIARSRGALTVSEEAELAVRVHGDTAIVTGVWDVAAGERRGRLRFTRVWVRADNGRWRMAAWHGSDVRATAPGQQPGAAASRGA
jgi:ketosteroid isomerase-like protein